jgi:hypothetical protein
MFPDYARIVSQLEETLWYWRGPEGHKRETRNHRFEPVSTIEPILKFSQVSRHVDGSVSSNRRRFNISQDGVDPFEGRLLGSLGATAGLDGGVRASDTDRSGEAGEPVEGDASAGGSIAVPANISIADLFESATHGRTIWSGLPSSVVAMAATKGVLPPAPRLRWPGWAPPMHASSICTRPFKRFVEFRSNMTWASLCFIVHGHRADARV